MPFKQKPADDRPAPRKPSARSSAKAKRSAARLTAVQILYQAGISGAGVEEVLTEFSDYRIGQLLDGMELVAADREMLAKILDAVHLHQSRISEILTQTLQKEKRERLEKLLTCIMTAGIAEMIADEATPAAIIISSYMAVSDAFYDDKETKLVNAVLDAAAPLARASALAGGDLKDG
jgi:N utilization substance protein B